MTTLYLEKKEMSSAEILAERPGGSEKKTDSEVYAEYLEWAGSLDAEIALWYESNRWQSDHFL